MPDFSFAGQLFTRDEDLDYGFSDVAVVSDGRGTQTLVAASSQTGAVVTWSLGSSASNPRLQSVVETNGDTRAGQDASLLILQGGSGPQIAVAGLSDGDLTTGDLNGSGALTRVNDVNIRGQAEGGGGALSNGNIVLSGGSGNGISVFQTGTGSNWSSTTTFSGPNAVAIDTVHVASVNGNDIVMTASSQQGQITAYQFNGTDLLEGDSLGQQDGTGLLLPTDITSVSIDGSTFVIAASASGQSGVLSVFELSATGQMVQTDQVMDSLNTRFGQVQTVEVIAYKDGALVVAGGGDDGLSLFAMSDNGTVTHLSSIADQVQSGLTNVEALDITLMNNTLHIFVAGQADAGLSHMTVDLAAFGDILTASNRGGDLTGTARDDILFASNGTDILDGGSGRDLFVITEDDADADIIENFNVSQDRIDLSGWNFLYDVNDLTIWSTNSGARIQHGDQLLELRSSNGRSISVDDVRATIELDVNRLPTIEQITRMGNNAANIIEGGGAQDTLSGGGGNDSVFGFNGDDIFLSDAGSDQIFGGGGDDTLRFDFAREGLEILAHNASSVTVSSQDGTDQIFGVEFFQFTDGTVSFDDLLGKTGGNAPMDEQGSNRADVLQGGGGNDKLAGLGGNDEIRGNAGRDVLTGGSGNDVLFGGKGNDRQFGGAGDDKLYGGGGKDFIKGGGGADTIKGGAKNDNLSGQGGNDVINGQAGKDILKGNGGNDRLFGGGGNDRLFGNKGSDILNGDNGADKISGGGGNDLIFGDRGRDSLNGGGGNDRMFGGTGNDVLAGGGGNDALFGLNNNDRLVGGGGKDALSGGSGRDVMFGGAQSDRLDGGDGNDVLTGGNGRDTFLFQFGDDSDVIRDFNLGVDTLRLEGRFFSQIGDAGDVISEYAQRSGGDTILNFGNGQQITLKDVTDLSALENSIVIE